LASPIGFEKKTWTATWRSVSQRLAEQERASPWVLEPLAPDPRAAAREVV